MRRISALLALQYSAIFRRSKPMASYESMSGELIEERLSLLAGALLVQGSPRYELVVCGGSALAVLGLHARTTRDVDVLALMNPDTRRLERPDPIPMPLAVAAATVARRASLPANWLNNGPSSGEGGLFQMGLPEGIEERLTTREYGERLAVHFVSRFDQIHFKLYAAIDQQGSYHTADLRKRPACPMLTWGSFRPDVAAFHSFRESGPDGCEARSDVVGTQGVGRAVGAQRVVDGRVLPPRARRVRGVRVVEEAVL
ncbi:MAG: hypothetical protein KF858_04695 [Candidatus Sumerlaeia bacterium]|nr:hypothetical protein [Candidatus Sumerlaeia bacterium]